jgi:hypothetical protein
MAAKNILSQLNMVEVAALTDSGTGFIGFGAKADGLYMKNGAAAELRLLTAGDVGVNVASYGHSHSGYQAALSGTGFVKISGTAISYDPTTYLSTKANVESVLTGSISSHYHDLSGYATSGHTHTGVYQPLDADLTAIAALAGTTGLLKKTATDTWTLDNTSYVSGTPWTAMGYVTGTPWTSMGYLTNLATGTSAQLTLTNPGGPMFSIVTGAVGSASTALATGSQIYSFVTGLGYLTAITKAQVEAVLTGTISSHSHAAASHNIQSHSDVYIPVALDASYSGKSLYWSGSNWGIGTPWTSAGYLTSITKAQVEAVLSGAIATHTHSYEPTLGNPGTNGYVLSSTAAGVRSWVALSGGYTLPAAGVGSLGGIKLGFTATGSAVPLQTSSDMGFVTVSKASVEYVLTGSITTHTHSYAPINGSSSNAFATANLSVTGTISASSTITGSEVYRGSSRILKKNIADFNFDAIGFLNDVSIKRYYLKSNNLFGIGFIAEDTHPWLSGDDQKSHVFGNHLGLLTKAIQEEDQKVEAVKLEVLELQARVRELEIARANGWR